MTIPRPTKGDRKSAQHARMAAKRAARHYLKAARPRFVRDIIAERESGVVRHDWRVRSAPLAKIGAVGKRQAAWNGRMRRVWNALCGHEPWPVVAGPLEMGGAGVPFVVGHILARKPHPEVRMDPLNVAPITAEANRLMSEPGPFCAIAQERMRAWIAANREEILRLYELTL